MVATASTTTSPLAGPDGEGDGVPRPKEPVVSAADAAVRLGVTVSAIHKAIYDGRLPARRVGAPPHRRGVWVIREADLDAYLARQVGRRKPGRSGGAVRDFTGIDAGPASPPG